MLASIHPLGERARNQRFAVTVIAYALGSVLGAAALGAILGMVGRIAFGSSIPMRASLLAVAAVVAFVVDRARLPIPSWRRQVNEDWLSEFRGAMYGVGFGAQLGLGVVTIVTTASVYLTWIAATTMANVAVGALVGAAFGMARALPVLLSARVRSPASIAARVRILHAWDGRFGLVTVVSETVVACVAIVVAVQ